MAYLKRIADAELAELLGFMGAVVIEGPRGCGKTETGRQIAASELLLDTDPQAIALADVDPGLLLPGATPRLLDEWQATPSIWNHVRREVDTRQTPGQFILTGSATPADDQTRHSGAGRFARLRMRPMSLFEAGRSTGATSLKSILSGEPTASPASDLTLSDLIDEVLMGGWPGFRQMKVSEATVAVRSYIDQTCRTDVQQLEGTRQDPLRVRAVVESLARNTATPTPLTLIARDCGALGIADDTVASYINALERLMVVENQPAWRAHLRSSHQLRVSPSRHFVDPSLAAAAVRATPESLHADLNFFGLLFESLVVRDLRIYAQPLAGEVCRYRDSSGLEVDAVIDTGSEWAAFEVKLASAHVDEAAANLLRFADRVDTSRRGQPAALAVITGNGYGYVRADGVHVIPIGTLAP